MGNERLSGILALSKISSVLILSLPFLLLGGVILSKQNSKSCGTTPEEFSGTEYSMIAYVTCKDANHPTVIRFEDGITRISLETVTCIARKTGLTKINKNTAVNPAKGCRMKIEEGYQWKTSDTAFHISRRFSNFNELRQLPECPM